MRNELSSVITITDVSPRSDNAVLWAGLLAAARGWDLHVVYAMGSIDATKRSMPIADLHSERLSADFAARAQLRRLLGDRAGSITPLLDRAGPREALLRASMRLRPDLAVLPWGWDWERGTQRGTALTRRAITKVGTPVLVTGRERPDATGRVIVALDPLHLNNSVIECAGRWSYWLRDSLDMHRRSSDGSELEIMFVEGGPDGADFRALLKTEPSTVVVAPLESLGGSVTPEQMVRMMTRMLTEMEAPSLFVARSQMSSTTRVQRHAVETQDRRMLA